MVGERDRAVLIIHREIVSPYIVERNDWNVKLIYLKVRKEEIANQRTREAAIVNKPSADGC